MNFLTIFHSAVFTLRGLPRRNSQKPILRQFWITFCPNFRSWNVNKWAYKNFILFLPWRRPDHRVWRINELYVLLLLLRLSLLLCLMLLVWLGKSLWLFNLYRFRLLNCTLVIFCWWLLYFCDHLFLLANLGQYDLLLWGRRNHVLL